MKKSAEIVFYLLLGYIIVAGAWWSYLLHSKNLQAKDAELENVVLQLEKKGISDYKNALDYQKAEDYYQRQQMMILGESIVFLLLLLLGVWRIYKINQKQMALANQQQNFLLSITHELKSPIASVQLVLETLKKRQLSDAQIKKLSQNALNDNERLHKLVQDLLLAARVEGGYEYSFQEICMQELLEDCLSWLRTEHQLLIKTTVPDTPIYLAKADYSTLSSALFNLLDNALKYASSSATPIELSLGQKKDNCIIEIKDQGPGIPKGSRTKVFDKFYRIGDEQTRKTKGTGLGLYIVKKVIEAHQGLILIKDNSPKGSIFHIQLPMYSNSIKKS